MANPRRDYEALRRTWARLPTGPMSEGELEQAIVAAAGLREGDFAGASAQAWLLKSGGAIRVVATDGGLVNLRADAFPEFVDPTSPAAMQAATVKAARREHEERVKSERRIARRLEQEAAAQEARDRPYIDRLVDARLRELGLMPSGDTTERMG